MYGMDAVACEPKITPTSCIPGILPGILRVALGTGGKITQPDRTPGVDPFRVQRKIFATGFPPRGKDTVITIFAVKIYV